MATSDLYGWFPTMSQPLTASPIWTTPERAPGALPVNQDPRASLSTNFQPGAFSQLAYQMAGSPKRGPLTGSALAPVNMPEDSGDGGSGGALLGGLGALGGLGSGNTGIGSSYGNIFGGFGSSNGSLGNVPIGVISDDPRTGGISGNLPTSGDSSSMLGNVAGGAAGALNLYSGIQQGGQQGTAQALLGAGKVAGSVASAAPSSALGSAIAGSGAATALPIAAGLFIAGDYLNKAFLGNGSKDRNTAAYREATGAQQVTLPMGKFGANYMVVPSMNGNGYQLVSTQDFNDLAGNWYGATYAPDGNQSDWQAKYDEFSKNLQPAKLPDGYSFDATTGKIMYRGKVAGNYG